MHLNVIVVFPDAMLVNLDCVKIFFQQLKHMSISLLVQLESSVTMFEALCVF